MLNLFLHVSVFISNTTILYSSTRKVSLGYFPSSNLEDQSREGNKKSQAQFSFKIEHGFKIDAL